MASLEIGHLGDAEGLRHGRACHGGARRAARPRRPARSRSSAAAPVPWPATGLPLSQVRSRHSSLQEISARRLYRGRRAHSLGSVLRPALADDLRPGAVPAATPARQVGAPAYPGAAGSSTLHAPAGRSPRLTRPAATAKGWVPTWRWAIRSSSRTPERSELAARRSDSGRAGCGGHSVSSSFWQPAYEVNQSAHRDTCPRRCLPDR